MMTLSRNIIHLNKSNHQEFEYYESIIEKVENNFEKNPDISIEASKSLIEGICKTILLRLEVSKTKITVDAMDFPELFRNSCWSIKRHVVFEEDFIHRASSLVHKLAELRNTRGDISHGKASPKDEASSIASAKMIMHITDAIINYILDSFFKIDLSFKEKIVYEDCFEFNEELDELNNLGPLSYSKALFDQDLTSYKEQLKEFNARKLEE